MRFVVHDLISIRRPDESLAVAMALSKMRDVATIIASLPPDHMSQFGDHTFRSMAAIQNFLVATAGLSIDLRDLQPYQLSGKNSIDHSFNYESIADGLSNCTL
jgi:hypothetical protein